MDIGPETFTGIADLCNCFPHSELSRNALFAPDLVASSARVFAKMAIAFIEVVIGAALVSATLSGSRCCG